MTDYSELVAWCHRKMASSRERQLGDAIESLQQRAEKAEAVVRDMQSDINDLAREVVAEGSEKR